MDIRAFRSNASDLDAHFVSSYLGRAHIHISRQKASLQQMTAYSSVLFSDRICIVWDGTYYYFEKSSSYFICRHTYSGQKHRPLLKCMSIFSLMAMSLTALSLTTQTEKTMVPESRHILNLNGDLTDRLHSR